MPKDNAAPVDKARASHTSCRVGVLNGGADVIIGTCIVRESLPLGCHAGFDVPYNHSATRKLRAFLFDPLNGARLNERRCLWREH